MSGEFWGEDLSFPAHLGTPADTKSGQAGGLAVGATILLYIRMGPAQGERSELKAGRQGRELKRRAIETHVAKPPERHP